MFSPLAICQIRFRVRGNFAFVSLPLESTQATSRNVRTPLGTECRALASSRTAMAQD
jgi:hypothetical protein